MRRNVGGAQIQRSLNLSGVTAAILSYSYDENSFDAGETVQVQFSADGTTFTTIQTIDGNSGEGTFSVRLVGPFTSNGRHSLRGERNEQQQRWQRYRRHRQPGDHRPARRPAQRRARQRHLRLRTGRRQRYHHRHRWHGSRHHRPGHACQPARRTLGPAPGERGPDPRLQRADGHGDRRVRQCGRRGRAGQLQQQCLRRARACRRLRGQLRHQ